MNDKITLAKTNILFLVIVFLFLTVGYYLQYFNFEIGIFLTEYVLILGTTIVFILLFKGSLSDYFKFNDIGRRNYFKVFLLALFSLPVVLFLNLAVVTVLEYFGKSFSTDLGISTNFGKLVIQFLLISVSAGLCEELVFRGFFMNAYLKYFRPGVAIAFAALTFGMLHFNIQNLLGPIYLGVVFGIMAYRMNSIIPAIFGHMLNNGIVFVINSISLVGGTPDVEVDFNMYLQTLGSLVIIAAVSLVIIVNIISSVEDMNFEIGKQKYSVMAMTPLLLVAVIYVAYTFLYLL